MVVESWNWWYHGQTIHPTENPTENPTEKFTSMNLYKIIEGLLHGPPRRLQEAEHDTATAHFGTFASSLSASSAYKKNWKLI